jgi:hypothetical protein
VHGIEVDTEFALYASGTTDFSSEEKRLAHANVTEVNAVDSWAEVVTQSGEGTLEAGAQALLLKSNNLRLQRDVAVAIEDAGRKAQVEQAIAAAGKGFVAVARREKSDFQVALGEQQTYEIWDAAGVPLPNLRPAIGVDDANALEQLVKRLVHLAKYYAVRALSAPGDRQRLEVSLGTKSRNGANSDTRNGGAPVYKPGDKISFVIKNTQTPGAANDPARILNISVLDLAADWSITQLYPAGAAAFEALDPGATIDLELEAFLPSGYSESLDILKVFATQGTTDFRWLQLPALDQPPVKDAIKRTLIKDPLEKLLAAVTGEKTSTRAIRLTDSPQAPSWSSAQVELLVKS